MRKRVILYLSAIPEDGGKFQYSLSILEAFQNLDSQNFEKIVIYKYDVWESYIFNVDKSEILSANSIFVSAIKNSLYLLLPNLGRNFWKSFLGKFVDRNHQDFYRLNPDLVVYASKDPFIHEIDLPGLVPIFDLMHKYESFPELFNKSINNDRELYYKRLAFYSKGILVDSILGGKHVYENYPEAKDKIHVLRFACPSYIVEKRKNQDIISKFNNLPGSYFFYPAQFWLHKNHQNIIKAIRQLKNKGIDIKCVFAGSKKNGNSQILRLIAELELNENILILDYVSNEEIVELYKNALALIMPTFFGPTNIPPLEAITLGCPVITSKIYASEEQLGDSALFVNPKSVDEISEAMYLVYSNEEFRSQLIQRGLDKSAEYSIQVFSSKFQRILHSLLWEKV
jgi:glycosyltransferase involved in cell wall biosynthesis